MNWNGCGRNRQQPCIKVIFWNSTRGSNGGPRFLVPELSNLYGKQKLWIKKNHIYWTWCSWIRASYYNSYRNSQRDVTVYQNFLLFYVYIKLKMFRVTHRPSSGAQNCTSSLWFWIRERLLDVVVAGRRQLSLTAASNHNVQQPFTYAKPEAASAVLSSWWWGLCRPKHVELYINIE